MSGYQIILMYEKEMSSRIYYNVGINGQCPVASPSGVSVQSACARAIRERIAAA